MAEVTFLYNCIPLTIQCQMNDTFKEIVKYYGNKSGYNTNSLIFIYNAEKIKLNLTFEQIAIQDDKLRRKMKVLVFAIEQNKEIKNDNILTQKTKINSFLEPNIKELKSQVKELDKNTAAIKLLIEENKLIKKKLKELEQMKYTNNSQFKKGMIISWYGNYNEIPKGWAICDGLNGTPDLRDRFIIGASNNIKFGSFGGKSIINLSKNNLPPIGTGYFSALSYRGSWDHSTNGFIKHQGSYSTYIKKTKNGDAKNLLYLFIINLILYNLSQFSVCIFLTICIKKTKNGDDWGSNWLIDLNEGMNSSPIDIMNPYFASFFIMKL